MEEMLKIKIKIVSNFLIPGFEGKDEVDVNKPSVTLQGLLEEVSLRSSGRVNLLSSSAEAVGPMNFIIAINGLPNSGSKESLNMTLKEGDVMTINLSPLGGG